MKLFKVDPPQTWEDLVALRDKLPCCTAESVRFEDDLCFYRQYTKEVPRETRLQVVFNLIGDSDTKIVRNNFPYLKLIQNIDKVTHFCLWSKIGPLTSDQIETEIKKEFAGKSYFWFENSDAIKSIPEIWHCHIFVKED